MIMIIKIMKNGQTGALVLLLVVEDTEQEPEIVRIHHVFCSEILKNGKNVPLTRVQVSP